MNLLVISVPVMVQLSELFRTSATQKVIMVFFSFTDLL
ncbi:hypothetical protein LEP1GSC074_3903 [Leptospira noguchii str. Hook]|nr:hypothetical protein LEP1GSC074_3903 [Leptospira noguchii str. Hook]